MDQMNVEQQGLPTVGHVSLNTDAAAGQPRLDIFSLWLKDLGHLLFAFVCIHVLLACMPMGYMLGSVLGTLEPSLARAPLSLLLSSSPSCLTIGHVLESSSLPFIYQCIPSRARGHLVDA